MESKRERMLHWFNRMSSYGINYSDTVALRRIEMTLSRWGELECGDGNNYNSWAIERDPDTDKPYMVTYPHNGKSYRTAIPDRENGALKRLAGIMARYPTLVAYHQTDPRGCSLYVIRKDDIIDLAVDRMYNPGRACNY